MTRELQSNSMRLGEPDAAPENTAKNTTGNTTGTTAGTGDGPATKAESLAYLTVMAAEMSLIANRAGFGRLATILTLAKEEAEVQRFAAETAAP